MSENTDNPQTGFDHSGGLIQRFIFGGIFRFILIVHCLLPYCHWCYHIFNCRIIMSCNYVIINQNILQIECVDL